MNMSTYGAETVLNIGNSKASRKWRFLICEEAGGRCHWCAQKMRRDTGFMDSVTIEHMIPQSKGGGNERWNLAAACYRCNTARRDSDADAFEIVARRFQPDTRTVEEVAAINKRERRRRYRQRKRAQGVVHYNIFNAIFSKIGSFA